MLTGYALASARGQTQIGDRVVLCSGHAVVLVYGPDGAPAESPYFCPDMAVALLAAVSAVVAFGALAPRVLSIHYDPVVRHGKAVAGLGANARDPPSGSFG